MKRVVLTCAVTIGIVAIELYDWSSIIPKGGNWDDLYEKMANHKPKKKKKSKKKHKKGGK